MALSFSSVQKAYEVFNELKRNCLPSLDIPSFPEDMQDWSTEQRTNPFENIVYGFDIKYDNGWENLFFFVKNPSEELKKKFDELKSKVPNSAMSEPYSANPKLWIFGWF